VDRRSLDIIGKKILGRMIHTLVKSGFERLAGRNDGGAKQSAQRHVLHNLYSFGKQYRDYEDCGDAVQGKRPGSKQKTLAIMPGLSIIYEYEGSLLRSWRLSPYRSCR